MGALTGFVPLELSPAMFGLFSRLVYEESGIYLTPNKLQLVRSRLMKRIYELRLPTFKAYYRYVKSKEGKKSGELTRMIDVITTNKTEFFRHDDQFGFLKTKFRTEWRLGGQIQILCAGCSTGEEPYTVAITALDALGPSAAIKVRVRAGDLSTEVLETAKRAVYPRESVSTVPRHLVHTYFRDAPGTNGEQVKVVPAVRRLVTFRHLNLMEPLPFDVQFHAILCRNVAIYFDRPSQQVLFTRFHHALREGGYLLLGHSESLVAADVPFERVATSVYRKV